MHYSGLILPFAGIALVLAGCARDEPPGEDAARAGAIDMAAAAPASWLPAADSPGECLKGGRLTASLVGAVSGAIDWRARDMSCEGMPRPDGAGARLRFAGRASADGAPIAVIIAIPGLRRGVAGTDLPSNVTIIEEGKGRFFSSADLDFCWVDIDREKEVPDRYSVSTIDGTLSCIAPLAETNGASSVTIESLTFSGFVDWTDT